MTADLDPRALAAVQLVERTGARSFRIGYSDPASGEPVVWYATATWGLDPATGRPMPKGGRIRHEAAAATPTVRTGRGRRHNVVLAATIDDDRVTFEIYRQTHPGQWMLDDNGDIVTALVPVRTRTRGATLEP